MRGLLGAVILFLGANVSPIAADDWPQFRGAERDGISLESGLLRSWPKDGPKVLWRRSLGEGLSGISAAGGRLATLYVDPEDEVEYVAAFDASDGSLLWRRSVGERFVDLWGNGPRATPAIADGVVYAVSARGRLVALQIDSGDLIWEIDIPSRFGEPIKLPTLDIPFMGYCSSPLIEGDLLILFAGAADGHGVLAFDRFSGDLRWSSLDKPLGHASPQAATIQGRRQILALMPDEIAALAPETGEVLWRYPAARATIAQPIILGEGRILISAPNDVGAVLLQAKRSGDGWNVEELWRDPFFRNNWQSSVARDGVVVGFDNATLKALDADGQLLWAHRGLGKGTLLLADDLLIVLSDRGFLSAAPWSREGYRELGRIDLLQSPAWTLPTLVDGRLMIRDHHEMMSLDLRGAGDEFAVRAADENTTAGKSAKNLVESCADALGGDSAWSEIRTMKLVGRHNSFSRILPATMLRARPNLYRFDHNELDLPLTTAFDGEEAWIDSGFYLVGQSHWPVTAPDRYADAIRDDAEFEMPCLHSADKGFVWRELGEIEAEGERFLGLELIRPDGREEIWHLDPTTYRPKTRRSVGTYHGYFTEQIQRFLDYRRVGDVWIPHWTEKQVGNDFLIFETETVELNAEIDPVLFSRPLPHEIEALQSLVGEWDVEITHFDDPALHFEEWPPPPQTIRTRSTIRARLGGRLIEEEIDLATSRPRHAVRSFSWDRFAEHLRLIQIDTFSGHADILEGVRDDAGVWTLSNEETGTAVRSGPLTVLVRETHQAHDADAFEVRRERSLDGGASWLPDLHLVYRRASVDPEDDP